MCLWVGGGEARTCKFKKKCLACVGGGRGAPVCVYTSQEASGGEEGRLAGGGSRYVCLVSWMTTHRDVGVDNESSDKRGEVAASALYEKRKRRGAMASDVVLTGLGGMPSLLYVAARDEEC